MMWLKVRNWLAARRADLAETVFVLVGLAALALLTSVVWSLLVGGILGVVACERASSVGAQLKRAEKSHLRRVA